MIPNFQGDLLPIGEHETTLEEFEKKFVYNPKRQELFRGLKKLIDDLKVIGCKAIWIDGSFVTKKQLPKDIDICWDNAGIDFGFVKEIMPILMNDSPARLAQQNIYKADIFPAHIPEVSSKKFFKDFFQIDKNTGQQKGIIKINL